MSLFVGTASGECKSQPAFLLQDSTYYKPISVYSRFFG